MHHKLEVDSVLWELRGRKILSDIYLKCETGKITGLLGRNGSGKTSLMRIIYGDLNAYSKSVRIDGYPLFQNYKKPDLLVYLPQFNFIPKHLTLKRIFSDFNLDFSVFESRFPGFSLKYKSAINSLSGGQQRLVEIYIVIKSKSQFALLDEPFSHLSPILIDSIKELILEEKTNKGWLITDHLYRHIIEISDEVYLVSDGKTHLIKEITDLEYLGYVN